MIELQKTRSRKMRRIHRIRRQTHASSLLRSDINHWRYPLKSPLQLLQLLFGFEFVELLHIMLGHCFSVMWHHWMMMYVSPLHWSKYWVIMWLFEHGNHEINVCWFNQHTIHSLWMWKILLVVAIPKMHQNTGNHIQQIQKCVASLSLRLVEVHSHMALWWWWWRIVALFIMKVAHPWSRA